MSRAALRAWLADAAATSPVEETPEQEHRRWRRENRVRQMERWLYLAVLMDLYSRRIIGWSMGTRLHRTLTREALGMALSQRRLTNPLRHHSDQGVQYAATDYQAVLSTHGITGSMSRKGNCWDNAVVESFFKTLTVECVRRQRFQTRHEARRQLFEYIEVFYNRQRLHSTLASQSPVAYEALAA